MESRGLSSLMLMLLAASLGGAAVGYGVARSRPPANQEEVLRLLQEQGMQLAAFRAQQSSPDPAAGRCVVSLPPGALDAAGLRAEIARVLREELQAQKGATSPEPSEQAKAPEPTPANLEAHDRALRMIDAAVSERRWVERDAQEFRRLLPQMTDAQRKEAVQKLIVTLNGGGVSVQTGGPPF